MSTPLGDFLRAKRDGIAPADLGLPAGGRRRAPGLRRAEVAERARISVEYLTRIEQGRDRHPSVPVVNAIADALSLTVEERRHLVHLAKITDGVCRGHQAATPASRAVRPGVVATLRLLEPAVAMVTNRAGDVLVHTDAFGLVMGETGLLEGPEPNLTRYVFTDPRARSVFLDWDVIADEQAFQLWSGPSLATFTALCEELTRSAGVAFTRRLERHALPPQRPLALRHPGGRLLSWSRETLELPAADAQQIVVWLPADEATAVAVRELGSAHSPVLRAV